MPFDSAAYTWLAQALNVPAHTLQLTQLPGSTSSSLFLVQSPQASQPAVLRVLNNALWLAEEPDIAAHEAAALTEAQRANLRTPRLIAHAPNDVGFGWPVVLMSWLSGRIELQPQDFSGWVRGLAHELAAIHAHHAPAFPWHFRSWVSPAALVVPPWATRPDVWARALARMAQPPPPVRPVFIHRDYHPTNVLWQDAVVSGVVDWINACQGPAGVDVSHCRSNLVLMFGPAAAAQFLTAYCAAAPAFKYDLYWDLDSVFDMCAPQPPFYDPWLTFGLAYIPPEVLQQRVEAYLAEVMGQIAGAQTAPMADG